MTTSTRAALDAAIDDYGNATAREAENRDERTALDRAIAAHVAAEVARALEAAPEVEAAIGSVTCRRCDHDDPLGDSVSDALRAAIAADKARAVAAAIEGTGRAEQFADAICHRVGARDSGCGGQTVEAGTARLYADAAKRIDALIARDKARPTPDEARRLVEEFERACDAWQYRTAEARMTARIALLRALGVTAAEAATCGLIDAEDEAEESRRQERQRARLRDAFNVALTGKDPT